LDGIRTSELHPENGFIEEEWCMVKKVIILGAGGNCIDILDTINEINEIKPTYECIGFLSDNEAIHGKEYYQTKVLGPLSRAMEFEDCFFLNGIANEKSFTKKESIISNTGIPLERFENIIHPTASVSKMATIGKGVVIFQNVTITSNVVIGNHIMILPNSIISHDNVIHDYTSITGGVCISGGVTVGKSCYLGTNCSIRGKVEIGAYSLIGMGSIVLQNVKEYSVMVGAPARYLRSSLPQDI
jgi:sugar O-acyltransferase (sialic acid O-acetyltransferase NeuD family)